MKWITREHPKIDRIACPWLIKNFIDKDAEFIYVPFNEVKSKAAKLKAIPFDVPDVEFTHYGKECTFDYFVKKYEINDPAIHTIAVIVRGADTDHHEIAAQSSGLWAISAGLAHNTSNDHELLNKGMMIYDALYSWAKFHQAEKHTQQPVENLLYDALHQIITKNIAGKKKIPAWAKELKEIIQDHVDTESSFNLKQLGQMLNVHPAYLSREFSKYFDDLSFGEYMRKIRIEKSMELLHSGKYSLTEIAYLTGFSDQSHFTRIFKKHTGKNPSAFKKDLSKSKKNTKD
jgi:hypothetical protein